LEQYFTDKREEEIKHLLEKMAVEEQAAITRLIEKHSQEMLLMIQEKVLIDRHDKNHLTKLNFLSLKVYLKSLKIKLRMLTADG